MKTIYSYTEPTPVGGYPAFVNVSKVKTDSAACIRVIVRSTDSLVTQEIMLTPEQCEALATDLIGFLCDGSP